MVFISEIFNINYLNIFLIYNNYININLNILYNLIHKKIKLNKNVE